MELEPVVYYALFFGRIILFIGIVLAFLRLIIGPSIPDRVVALDAICVMSIGILVLEAIATRKFFYLDIAAGMALVLFLTTVALAKYIEKGGPE